MTRARDNSRLVTTPSSAYDEFEEISVGSASPTDKKIWIDNTTASAPVIQTLSGGEWFGSILPSRTAILVDYLVIAGGGSGGSGDGGGGGAGGYRTSVGISGGGSSAESLLSLLIAGASCTVTVGAGGAAIPGTSSPGNSGSNSIFGTITSTGGGGGGRTGAGSNGGSGGGGGGSGVSNSAGGTATAGQGFNGGDGGSSNGRGAGGGGAGGVAPKATLLTENPAGIGLASSITGISVTRATGGVGDSATNPAASGVPNTGTGGNGRDASAGTSGAGGSGIVIIKFPDTFSLDVGAGLSSSNTTSGGYKIYTFTAGTDTVVFS